MNRKHTRVVLGAAALVVVFAAAATISFRTAGTGTLGSVPPDVLIVFGSPADISGALTPMQRWRVDEAVQQFRRRRAPLILFTGGAAANRFAEAEVMARHAIAMGVPPSAILTETASKTTVENIRDFTPMLRARHLSRAELISSADHLPRIAVLMAHAPFEWRLHPAPTPGRNGLVASVSYAEEALATLLLRTFGTAAEPIIHAVAVCAHWIAFLPRYVTYRIRAACSC